MSGIGALGEFGLIKALTTGLPGASGLLCGPGDDCAIVQMGNTRVLLSCDAMIEEVHFRRDWMTPEAIGRKAAAVALSDIAAMGGAARCLLITLGCPANTETEYLSRLYAGVSDLTRQFDVPVAGGDTVRTLNGIMLDIAVVGEMAPDVEPRYRSGAKPGDIIAVSGYPGSAALGMTALERGDAEQTALIEAHTRPRPRLKEGAWLARQTGVHAMIDVSDGLAQDLGHIAERSGVRVVIEKDKLPVSQEMRSYAPTTGRAPEEYALSGGEDYELAFTIAPDAEADVCAHFTAAFDLPLTCIGTVQEGEPAVLLNGHPITQRGFDHFAAGK